MWEACRNYLLHLYASLPLYRWPLEVHNALSLLPSKSNTLQILSSSHRHHYATTTALLPPEIKIY
ncbi:hypothetical protein HN51_032082 [Arachis hypogaea]